MSNYKRVYVEGGCYFFTVVTYRRQPILTHFESRRILRQVVIEVREQYPFKINAWVLLPDHFHCIWTLPEGDADYSKRMGLIKSEFSSRAKSLFYRSEWMNKSRKKHRESTIWQRRFWEHYIRNQDDFNRHMDYICWNPVKHRLVARVVDWQYSTFHRDVRRGIYSPDWGGNEFFDFDKDDFGE